MKEIRKSMGGLLPDWLARALRAGGGDEKREVAEIRAAAAKRDELQRKEHRRAPLDALQRRIDEAAAKLKTGAPS